VVIVVSPLLLLLGTPLTWLLTSAHPSVRGRGRPGRGRLPLCLRLRMQPQSTVMVTGLCVLSRRADTFSLYLPGCTTRAFRRRVVGCLEACRERLERSLRVPFSDVACALCCANAAAVHFCGLGQNTLRCGPLSCGRRPGDRPFSSMIFTRSVP
jgi:hypothetical protein